MLDDAEQALLLVLRNGHHEPEHVWGRLGVSLEVAENIAAQFAETMGLDPIDVIVLMETGALLVEAAREMAT